LAPVHHLGRADVSQGRQRGQPTAAAGVDLMNLRFVRKAFGHIFLFS
jgi:hypothetical protein